MLFFENSTLDYTFICLVSGFGGVGQDGGATGVNVKNVTASDGVVNDDFGLDSNFKLSASAIDQITAITQQATYKQSSHDVKKSGPAPLPSGIPVQTRADVVIESNTAPQGTMLMLLILKLVCK